MTSERLRELLALSSIRCNGHPTLEADRADEQLRDCAAWLAREVVNLRKELADHRCNGNHADVCLICKTIEDGGRDGGGCDIFSRGRPGGDCDGDGHYECKECVSYRVKL